MAAIPAVSLEKRPKKRQLINAGDLKVVRRLFAKTDRSVLHSMLVQAESPIVKWHLPLLVGVFPFI